MSKRNGTCIHCGNGFDPNPRIANQKYCGDKECQKARRASWQRRKMASDPDYRENQQRCQKDWQERHPGYYKSYRKRRPKYVERNRLLQRIRNMRRGRDENGRMIAKMDALLKPYYSRRGGVFRLIPQGTGMIAKMDALVVRLIPARPPGPMR